MRQLVNVPVYCPALQCSNCRMSYAFPFGGNWKEIPNIRLVAHELKDGEYVPAFEVEGARNEQELIPLARAVGWIVQDQTVLCPECQDRIARFSPLVVKTDPVPTYVHKFEPKQAPHSGYCLLCGSSKTDDIHQG